MKFQTVIGASAPNSSSTMSPRRVFIVARCVCPPRAGTTTVRTMFSYHEDARGVPDVDGHAEKMDTLSAAARTTGSFDGEIARTSCRSGSLNPALSRFHAEAMYWTAAMRASFPESASD